MYAARPRAPSRAPTTILALRTLSLPVGRVSETVGDPVRAVGDLRRTVCRATRTVRELLGVFIKLDRAAATAASRPPAEQGKTAARRK